MPTVSNGIDDLLTTTGETAAGVITAALQGAEANPARIGQEFLPEIIDTAFQLEDATNEALPLRVLTGGADPKKLYIHNAIDNGGIEYSPVPRNTLIAYHSFPSWRLSGEVVYAVCTGTIYTTGNLTTTFTSAATGVLTIPVAVTSSDTKAEWGAKVAAAWNANATFAASYFAFMAGMALHAQSKTGGAVDGTLSFTLADGTATGVTSRTGTKATQFTWLEIGDFDIKASEAVVGQKFVLKGNAEIFTNGSTTSAPANLVLVPDNVDSSLFSNTNLHKLALTKSSDNYLKNSIAFNMPLKFRDGNFPAAGTRVQLTGLLAEGVPESINYNTVTKGDGSFDVTPFATVFFNNGGNTSIYSPTKINTATKMKLFLQMPVDSSYPTTGKLLVCCNLQLVSGAW